MISNIKYILYGIVLIIIGYGVFLYKQNKDLKTDLEIQKHNELALIDTLRVVKTKNGELLYDKKMFVIQSKDDLEKLTNLKNSEIESLEKELKTKVSTISQLTGDINTLNGHIRELNTQILSTDSSSYKIIFGESDKWHSISGYMDLISKTKPISYNTYLTVNKINLSLKVGVTKDNRIFVETDGNPYISISNISGANLTPNNNTNSHKKNRIGVGFYGGYGYSLTSNKFEPNIGIGVQWILFSF